VDITIRRSGGIRVRCEDEPLVFQEAVLDENVDPLGVVLVAFAARGRVVNVEQMAAQT
jgi:hypothetical protein